MEVVIRELCAEFCAFLADEEATFDHVFEELVVERPPAAWRIDGVVRGAHRVWPVGGPDPTRRLAVAADVRVDYDDGAGARAHTTLTSGAFGLRVDVDRPYVIAGALPSTHELVAVCSALAAAGVQLEIHGPRGRLAAIDLRCPPADPDSCSVD